MFIMANNEKIKEQFEQEKRRIDELVAARDELFIKRDNITSFGTEKREAIREINAQIKTLNHELSEIGRELTENNTKLPEELKKITKIKGKKDHVTYEINGKKETAHVASNSKGKFNNIVFKINLNNQLLAYFKETVTIKENGIVSQFAIDEDLVANMTLEERLTYYNELCAKISNPDIVKDPAKSVTLGKRYCLVSECDLEVYIESLNRYKDTLVELETQKGDRTRLQAAQIFASQAIKIADVELSKFRIDWNLVNSFETLEEKAEYFNNLAKEIASAPKIEPKKVPLGKSYAIVNKCDEMIFLQCFQEYSKVQKAIKASKAPSYTIDWEYVNSLDSALKRAEYFENLCGKIDAVEKFETVTITFRNHSFTVNKIDADIFTQAMQEFEKNYLQVIKERKEAEQARIEEEKRQEEARKEAERLEQEEKARKEEEERLEQERIEKEKIEQAIAEAKRLEEEKKQAEALAQQKEMERMEALAKEAEEKKGATIEPNTEQIVATTLAAIESGLETEKHIEERDLDLDEEYPFLNGKGTTNPAKEETIDTESTLDKLNEMEMTGEDEGEIDFFDDDDEEEKADELPDEDKDPSQEEKDDDIQKVADALGGEIIEIGGLQLVDLSPEDKKEKEDEEPKENKDDVKEGKKKNPLKGLFKGKKGKKEKNAENAASYEIPSQADTIELEITDEDTLKVLASRRYIGNISESKLYTSQKELYISIMDWIEDQKITNKVTVVTKRHTAEIDAKFEDIYTFISNRYEKLEDKYERIAADKYHNLKVRLAVTTGAVACGAVLLFTAGKGLFMNQAEQDNVNVITDHIKYEAEQDVEGSLINASGYDAISTVSDILMETEEKIITPQEEIIEEKENSENSTIIPGDATSSRSTSIHSGAPAYNYIGTSSREAFNINPDQLGISEEEASEEIKKAAEANKVPLLEIVR